MNGLSVPGLAGNVIVYQIHITIAPVTSDILAVLKAAYNRFDIYIRVYIHIYTH